MRKLARKGAHAWVRRRVPGAALAVGAPFSASTEPTWRILLGAHFALQPDVQYIDDPNTDPSIADALVVMLRVEAAF